jgi:dienelactone hydrolase
MTHSIGIRARFGVCLAAGMVALALRGGPVGPWDRDILYKTPRCFEAAEFATNGVTTVFYESEPYQGRPTRVFAYYGLPAGASSAKKVPGIVLIHGGAGSAFVRWVKLWNSRGYAAISMDTCGAVSGNAYGDEQKGHRRHAWSGPPGWGGFDNYGDPVADQWTYHAVAAAVRGHSLLRSLPEVDASRVGLTGISWGGYLTCIVAAVDDRFAFAVPVYGCGFLGDNSTWIDRFHGMGKVNAGKWLGLWDPSVYLPRAEMPFLWVTGSNDFAYPMDSLQKSCRALKVPYTLCVRLRMPHGHGAAGENPAEILAFADSLTRGGKPLPAFTRVMREGRTVKAAFVCNGRAVVKAELNVTKDAGKWKEKAWEALPVAVQTGPDGTGTVDAQLSEQVTVFYLNIVTDDGLVVSSEHEVLD